MHKQHDRPATAVGPVDEEFHIGGITAFGMQDEPLLGAHRVLIDASSSMKPHRSRMRSLFNAMMARSCSAALQALASRGKASFTSACRARWSNMRCAVASKRFSCTCRRACARRLAIVALSSTRTAARSLDGAGCSKPTPLCVGSLATCAPRRCLSSR